MHLPVQLTRNIELEATRREEWDIEVVTMDGGTEVRNARWSEPLRSYEVALPASARDNSDYLSVKQMWRDSEGGAHSFLFYDYSDDELVTVRFDGPLEITHLTGWLDKIETFVLKEVR